ncbi:MAG: hypothetical protein NVS9B12_04800 [Vulcanimicrobiaceae bacterium]
MPLYDYQCSNCKEITEVRHGFDDAHTDPCPKCAGPLMRLFNPASIVFKGSGFYITDSRKSESKSPAKTEAKSESKADSKPDSKPDAKPESKSDPKPSSGGSSESAA